MSRTTKEKKTDRRGVLKKIWIGLGVLALAEFTGIALSFLWPRKPKTNKGSFGGTISAGSMTTGPVKRRWSILFHCQG